MEGLVGVGDGSGGREKYDDAADGFWQQVVDKTRYDGKDGVEV